MFGVMFLPGVDPAGQGARQLSVDQKPYSDHVQYAVVDLPGGILQRGLDVAFLQVGVVLDDLRMTSAGSQQIEDIGYPDTHTADAGAAAALQGIDSDALEFAHEDLPVAF